MPFNKDRKDSADFMREHGRKEDLAGQKSVRRNITKYKDSKSVEMGKERKQRTRLISKMK